MAIKDIAMPSFYTDPTYKQTQEYLAPYGMDIMKGNIPDYYKGIGMTGSPEFLDMLDMAKRDISTAVTEDMARRNVSGGAGALAIAKGVGDVSKTMRYDDYLRSLQGKEFLFTGGKSITEGAREAGLSYGTSMNQFNLGTAELGLKKEGMLADQKAQEKAREDAMWQNIFSGVLGGAVSLTGMGMLSNAMRGSASAGSTGISMAGGLSKSGWVGY